MTFGLMATAFGLGLRHGIDWDHVAAITDLTGTGGSRRRGFVLSIWYAVGHALVVFVLGAALILAGSTIPASLDEWMGRVVGATLVLLGVWVVVDLRRSGADFRLRSRWMLVLDGTFAGLRRVRQWGGRRQISVVHDHPHDHEDGLDHETAAAHDHAHVPATTAVPIPVGAAPRSAWSRLPWRHHHRHSHAVELPVEATRVQGAGVAAGVGVLHGVGVESPTQIAIFVSSTAVVGRGAGLVLLAAWVVGLVMANGALALAAGRGLLHPTRQAGLYRALALVIAAGSVALGGYYLIG